MSTPMWNDSNIRFLLPNEPITDEWIEALDHYLKSDGCTYVIDFCCHCCIVHDLGCAHHLDPWGRTITRREADRNFRLCIQSESRFGKYSPMSWIRWAGVRIYAIATRKK